MSTPSVYLIEAENGLVKIGFGAEPAQRAASVRLHSPVLTRLIAHWPADRAEGVELHERFESVRQHGEWFRPEGLFAQFVSQRRGLNVAEIADWQDLGFGVRLAFRKRRARVGREVKGIHRVHSSLSEVHA
jgi:hypothetical protein